MIEKVKAICIKQYIDEDDLYNYNEGEISFNEIKHYEKGKEYLVMKNYYDKNYYELI